jgi:hypothetical protein
MRPELSSDRGTVSVAVPALRRRRDGAAGRAALERVLSGWTARCVALVATYVAISYAVSAAIGLPIHWPLEYLYQQVRWIFLITYAPLMVGCLLAMAGQQREVWQRWRRFVLSPVFFLEFAVAMVVVNATIMVFVNLKQFIPALNERLYDSPLWRLDNWLHFGFEPAVVATELAAQYGLLPWLDRAYLLFYPAQVAVPLLFLVAKPLRPLRGRFFFAFCLLWMLGGLVYVLWPTLGPVYYRASRFVWLDQAPYAQYVQNLLMQDYVRFRTDPSYYTVKLYQGVAALPSLHVGVLALFAIATWRWRALAIVLWLLTAVTFVGSLALGWHYAVDGYAGLLLAALTWLVAGRVVDLEADDCSVLVLRRGARKAGDGAEREVPAA